MKKAKLLALFGSVCLVLALAVSLSGGLTLIGATEQQDELPPGIAKKVEPEPELLPPSTQPLVILSGSDYEMGYQYGYQAAEGMNWFKNKLWAEMLGEEPGAYYGMGGWTEEEVYEILQGFQYYIREYTPEFIDIFKGMADGSTAAGYPISYADALLMNAEWDMEVATSEEANYPEPVEPLPPHHCSSFAAWGDETSEEGSVITIHSEDDPFAYTMGAVVFPDEGNNVIQGGGEAGTWAFTYLQNDKGLFIGLTASPAKRDVDNQFGLPVNLSLFHLARYCDTAEEAKDMLLSFQLTCGYIYLISDSDGDCYAIETTGAHKTVRTAGDFDEGDFLVITNHYITEEMQVSQGTIRPTSSTARRYEQLFDNLTEYAGSVDFEFAKLMLRTPPVCRSSNRSQWIGVYEEGEKPETYVCTGASNFVEDCGSRTFPIEPTYSFYQLVLEDSPLKVVKRADRTARSYTQKAIIELNKLTYSDVAYAPLNELLEKAKTEYYKGWALRDEGTVSQDTNERLDKYSQALTAYTRCQAISLQVYNALVPFPSP